MRNKWYQQTDVMLGAAVVAVIAMLIIPIPTLLLDILLGFSIMIALVILLTAMNSRNNLEFTVFPSLLLVTTVYRLALNVSSTRLVLMEGPAFDGQLIRAFGQFVVGGNYVIGFVIFIILVLVQMMVITKGATRISEVAARFTLDALPGKQMSIDSDLSAGLITEEEARRKREELRTEVDFYGHMDGATKFIQGDVRVGLLITAINIIGGLIIGMAMRGEDFNSALKTYTLLTIGDGLVAQIPSLLITTATGMVVTRSGANKDLAGQIGDQLFNNPKILWTVSGTLFLSSLVPGFPKLSMWMISAFLGFLAYSITQGIDKKRQDEVHDRESKEKKKDVPESFLDEISMDILKLEIGFNLLPLVEAAEGGVLLERITNLRKKFAKERGLIVPRIRIQDNLELDGNEYSILVSGIEVARAKVFPDKLVAMDSGNVKKEVEGTPYKDPSYGLKSILISPDKKSEAEVNGYLVVDANNIIITHLSEVIRGYATQIMGREEIKLLIDKLKENFPSVVDTINKDLSIGLVQQVLHNLIKEDVSIRNANIIFESLADHGGKIKDPVTLTEYVRKQLGRQIVSHYLENGVLKAIQVDPYIENILRDSITYDEKDGRIYAIDPHDQMQIRDSFIKTYNELQKTGQFAVFLTASDVRMGVFMILERELTSRMFAVIAYDEISSDIKVDIINQVIHSEHQNKEEEVTF
ncbi:MAG: flagellar biosynthesis protein FlhA [Spirochaetia bacterium]|nr:flagellar biosynthesis protein FlhA [Spirochaetia bacterium]